MCRRALEEELSPSDKCVDALLELVDYALEGGGRSPSEDPPPTSVVS